MSVDPVEKVRESLMRADAEMKPGSASMGKALAHVVNAVEALADGLESVLPSMLLVNPRESPMSDRAGEQTMSERKDRR